MHTVNLLLVEKFILFLILPRSWKKKAEDREAKQLGKICAPTAFFAFGNL